MEVWQFYNETRIVELYEKELAHARKCLRLQQQVLLPQQPQQAQRYLMVWTQLMLGQMKARRGVRHPPPRPANWDVGAGGQA